jgi:hypothetical protein
LEELLTEYRDIFAVDSEDYRWTNRVYHCVDKGEAQLICQSPRRPALENQAVVGEMLEDMK